MPNPQLFASNRGRLAPPTDAVNEAGGVAYKLPPKQALAQYAVTGCLNQTYYVSAEAQLATVLQLCGEVEPEFIAKCAVYSRKHGYMKDMPALLLAVLHSQGGDGARSLLRRAFPEVIDNGRMLRGFVQIVRSGATGRKSFGRAGRRVIREWLDERTDEQLFRDSVGQNPSLADIVKMVHPKPGTPSRAALYGYLLGKEYKDTDLLWVARDYEAFKANGSDTPPPVPFQMLTSLDLDTAAWATICRNAKWQMTRMNLNTFQRHGVFGTDEKPDTEMVELVAERLRDSDEVRRARAFPYQLLAAYRHSNAPYAITEALQDAMEVALENVPAIEGKVYVFPDVSGSMSGSVTGWRLGATTVMRCVDVAALITAAILRKNPEADVIPFEHEVRDLTLNRRDTVLTNADKLVSIGGGGTNCSAPLALLNSRSAAGDMVIYVSDYESWVDGGRGYGATETMHQWEAFRSRNPQARMVCIDLTPDETSQAPAEGRPDILQVGGFSDAVFQVVADFAAGRLTPEHWVGVVDSVAL